MSKQNAIRYKILQTLSTQPELMLTTTELLRLSPAADITTRKALETLRDGGLISQSIRKQTGVRGRAPFQWTLTQAGVTELLVLTKDAA